MPRKLSGFTLVEVLVATGILVTVAAGSAQLFAIAMRQDVMSRRQLAMASAAAAKLDELAAAAGGVPAPAAAMGALDRDVSGYADTITISGFVLERRWIAAPLTGTADAAIAIVVRVLATASPGTELEIATIAEAATP